MTRLDRESWTARRVGPLDVDRLEDQALYLRQLTEQLDPHDCQEDHDLASGCAHLLSHLLDLYEYDVQDARLPLASRARRAISGVSNALHALADVLAEEDGEAIELQWDAPDVHELLAQLAGAAVIELEPVAVFPELNGGAS